MSQAVHTIQLAGTDQSFPCAENDTLLRAGSASAEEGDVVLQASSDKSISATIAALSVAIAGGSGNGLGASIGIAVARNLIGQEGFGRVGEDSIATVRALVIDSDITTGGVLDLRADARQVINSLVVSGSAAVGLGGGNGLAASGSAPAAGSLTSQRSICRTRLISCSGTLISTSRSRAAAISPAWPPCAASTRSTRPSRPASISTAAPSTTSTTGA